MGQEMGFKLVGMQDLLAGGALDASRDGIDRLVVAVNFGVAFSCRGVHLYETGLVANL